MILSDQPSANVLHQSSGLTCMPCSFSRPLTIELLKKIPPMNAKPGLTNIFNEKYDSSVACVVRNANVSGIEYKYNSWTQTSIRPISKPSNQFMVGTGRNHIMYGLVKA